MTFLIALFAVMTAFLNSTLAKMLDVYMNKGMILDFVRLRAAYFFSKRSGVDFKAIEENIQRDIVKDTKEGLIDSDNSLFEARAKYYDFAYWNLAFAEKWFTVFMCAKCMSFYLAFPVCFLAFAKLSMLISIEPYYIIELLILNHLLTYSMLD